MEISVNTRLKGGYDFKVDISITGLDAMKLPSFSIDQIREMVQPQVKALLLLDGIVKDDAKAEEFSRQIAYGTQPSQSASEEDSKSETP